MKTITIQIGNSDDKLTQERWAQFVGCCEDAINHYCRTIHFFACSDGRCRWQNAAWVIEANRENADSLSENLATIRADYLQDSIAWTEGETKFV